MYKKYNKNNLNEHLTPQSSFVSCPNMPGIIININIYVNTLLPNIDLSKENKNSIITKLLDNKINTFFPSTGTLDSIGYEIINILCIIYKLNPSRICNITFIPQFEDNINTNSTIQLSFIITDRKNGDMSYSSILADAKYINTIKDNLSFKCVGDWIIQDFIDSRVVINKINTKTFIPGNKPDSCISDGFTSNIIKPLKSDCSINYISNCYIHQLNNTIENFDQNISNKIVEDAEDAEDAVTTSNKIEDADEATTTSNIIEHADAGSTTVASAAAPPPRATAPLQLNPNNTSNTGSITTIFAIILIVGPFLCFLYMTFNTGGRIRYGDRFSVGE
jgi:hypothetical protein